MIKQLLREIKFTSETAGLILHGIHDRIPVSAGVSPEVTFFSTPDKGWVIRLVYCLKAGESQQLEKLFTLSDLTELEPSQAAANFLADIRLPIVDEHIAINYTKTKEAAYLTGWIMQCAVERLWIDQKQPLIEKCPEVGFRFSLQSFRWVISLMYKPNNQQEKVFIRSFSFNDLQGIQSSKSIAETILNQWNVPQRNPWTTSAPLVSPQRIPVPSLTMTPQPPAPASYGPPIQVFRPNQSYELDPADYPVSHDLLRKSHEDLIKKHQSSLEMVIGAFIFYHGPCKLMRQEVDGDQWNWCEAISPSDPQYEGFAQKLEGLQQHISDAALLCRHRTDILPDRLVVWFNPRKGFGFTEMPDWLIHEVEERKRVWQSIDKSKG